MSLLRGDQLRQNLSAGVLAIWGRFRAALHMFFDTDCDGSSNCNPIKPSFFQWSAMGMTIALTMRSVNLETTPVRGSPAHPLVATTAIAKPSATMRVNANAMTAITMTQPLC